MTDEHTFSLSHFLRICQMDTGERISAIDRKLKSTSGYDFYNSLQRAIRAHIEGKGKDAVDEILLSPKNAIEREYNIAAFQTFMQKYGSKRSLDSVKRPKKYSAPNASFSISCDPLFSTLENGVEIAHAIWATRSPKLQRKYAAVGCYILRECYRNTTLANCQFAIANLADGTRTKESSRLNASADIFRHDVQILKTLLEETT